MPKMVDRFGRPASGHTSGLVEAIVSDNVDPAQLGRVKVQYPTLPGVPASGWARIVTPMAGGKRGWVTIPEIGDEVLVSFMHGDHSHAIVIGSLFNGVDRPPYANEDGNNNLRVFQSRSGHRVTFDDTADSERIEIITHNEEIRIILDSRNRVLSVFSGGDIRIEARDQIHLQTDTLSINASDSINVTAGEGIILNGGTAVGILAGTEIQVVAPTVLIN